MKTIHLANASQIRDKVYQTIQAGKQCVVEASSGLDGTPLLVCFPNTA